MSQASDGDKYWYCINSACPSRVPSFPPISLDIGIKFLLCPFCNVILTEKGADGTLDLPQPKSGPETTGNVVADDKEALNITEKVKLEQSQVQNSSIERIGNDQIQKPVSPIVPSSLETAPSLEAGRLPSTLTAAETEERCVDENLHKDGGCGNVPSKSTIVPTVHLPHNLREGSNVDVDSEEIFEQELTPKKNLIVEQNPRSPTTEQNQDSSIPKQNQSGVILEPDNELSSTFSSEEFMDVVSGTEKAVDSREEKGAPVESSNQPIIQGPVCQYCNEHLLTSTASICVHCGHKQRTSESVVPKDSLDFQAKNPSNIVMDTHQQFGYHQVFGANSATTSTVVPLNTSDSETIKTSSSSRENDTHGNASERTIGDLLKKPRKRNCSSNLPGDQFLSKHFKPEEHDTSCASTGLSSSGSDRINQNLTLPSPPSREVATSPIASLSTETSSDSQRDFHESLYKTYRKQDTPDNLLDPQQKSSKGRKKDKSSTSETRGKQEVTVKIVFHVIIPKLFWEWDEQSYVSLRFGHHQLGLWDEYCCVFHQVSDDGNLLEMACQLEISKKLLEISIPYKYVVFTKKSGFHKDGYYEFIHLPGRNHRDPNRVFRLNRAAIQQAAVDGLYHHFDSMAFPRNSLVARSMTQIFVSGIKSIVGRKDDTMNLEVPEYHEMLQNCLMFYLNSYKGIILAAQFSSTRSIASVIEEVNKVFLCLLESRFTNDDEGGHHVALIKLNLKKNLLQETIVKFLHSTIPEGTSRPTILLTSSISILWCMSTLKISSDVKGVRNLFSKLLRWMCAHEREDSWLEWDHCLQFLKDEINRSQIGKTAEELLKNSIVQQPNSMDWMFGLPLCNFLMKRSEPFMNIDDMSHNVLLTNWRKLDSIFRLHNVRKKIAHQHNFVEQYYPSMFFLTKVDPLTLQALIFICPNDELCYLFASISPHIAISWMSYLLCEVIFQLSTPYAAKKYIEWLKVVLSNITNEANSNPLYLMESLVFLFEQCTVTKSVEDDALNVIHSVICVALEAISCYFKCVLRHTSDKMATIQEHIQRLGKVLRGWLSSYHVIGGNTFGYEATHSYGKPMLSKGTIEIKIWKCFLPIKCSSHKVNEIWQKVLQDILTGRLSKVPEKCALTLLCHMESASSEHEVLTNAIMDIAVKGAEGILLKQPDRTLTSFATDSRLLGRALGKLLKKQYPQLNADSNDWITLDVLLQWIPWPNYLRIIQQGNKSLLKEGLPEECHVTCVCAASKFEGVCKQIETGNINLQDLQKMKRYEHQVKKLCKAVVVSSQTTVIRDLNQRLKELTHFSTRQHAYLEVCKGIMEASNPAKPIAGVLDLKKELEKDYDQIHISDLCRVEHGDIHLCCLSCAQPLDSFVDNFSKIMSKRPLIFLRSLEKNIKEAMARLDIKMTLEDIYPMIWKPTIEFCLKLLNGLADCSIKLSYVDKHLRQYSGNLLNELTNVAIPMEDCSLSVPPSKHLGLAAKKVHDYWRLCRYQTGAQVFLSLRNTLNLKGDFSLIEKHFSVELKESMKDKCIKDIDDTLVYTGDFLEDIVDDVPKCQCLKTFSECQDLTQWLRTFTSSVNDIQGFVTVALATAAGGEGDYASDKLSHLRTVVSGFATLIYEVREDDDFQKLMERCRVLWDALKKNRDLPTLLESCNKDIEWYKSIKETQGSVETTSFGQMTNILKYGTYHVGFKENAQSVHDLISVSLSKRHQKLFKVRYTLDELRDLESKLVLICGNMADNRAEVDHYLNLLHSATRIAELYLDLQKAGEVTYTKVSLTFQCAFYDPVKNERDVEFKFNESKAKDKVAVLQEYIMTLDMKLVTWKKSVDQAREQYYHLNYFSTLQLLQLRKELGTLTSLSSSHTVKSQVLSLLKSVSPLVTSSVVNDALKVLVQHEPMDSEEQLENLKSVPSSDTDATDVVPTISFSKSTPDNSFSKSLLSLPERKLSPILSKEDLTEFQRKTFMDLGSMGFSDGHILKAFEMCGEKATVYDIEEWCEDNEDCFVQEEESSVDMADREEEMPYVYNPQEESDSDEEMAETSILSEPQLLLDTQDPIEVSPSTKHAQIKRVVRQVIDVSHPGVQELVEAGFDPQHSVEAIEQSMGDVHEAMKLLEIREIEEGDEPGIFLRSTSRDESMLNQNVAISFQEDKDFVESRSTDNSTHLEIDELGRVLNSIGKLSGLVESQRNFNASIFNTGRPNLLVTKPDIVLNTVLALYTEDHSLPLPTQEEVLFCTSRTTAEEVSLLWRRAIGDPGHKRVFCLAHAERLSYQVCDTALRSLQELSQGKKDYRLVVICSNEEEDKSHIISRLHNDRRPVNPKLVESDCRDYLKAHFVFHADMEIDGHALPTSGVCASTVDPDDSCVRVVSSTHSGMGKSLYVKQRATSLKKTICSDDVHVTIPVHGPVVTADSIMDTLKKHIERDNCTIYHLDIAPRVLAEVDCILFSLLILKGMSDSRGVVWRCHPRQLYMVEVTLPNDEDDFQTLHLLRLLPTIRCASPRDVLSSQQALSKDILGMDVDEFMGPTVQRVYQYLRRHVGGYNLDTFSYQGLVEGNEKDCLNIVLSKCGIRDPSWAEFHHFTKFLGIQLNSCEKSVFCDETLVGDVMSGLKGFVVKFMIRMSQDFSTPSLEGELARINLEEPEPIAADNQLEQYQIAKRRRWERTSHPYIFFNEDTVSITFLGFMVTQNGDLVDPANGAVLEQAIMRPQLYTGLKQNRVNFEEDYRQWGKYQRITKIATVMGFDAVYDPDDTYVLTTDNLIKMLAIEMRFRCDIPVVIMGETGCGKTRLIRYMCDLARCGRDIKNMLILKIHGGITDQNIINFMKDTEEIAIANKKVDPKLSTVVFFDEANTTESIGLIKEIMCDRRINGRPISNDIKFIAACNPYRRHSEEMIKNLETAGLGFYVRDTQQKLGKIPLRQLVYRVLDLPPSMRPLVYDFGQLNTGAEHDYISQIVKDHVQRHPRLQMESPAIIQALSIVLAESQKYMRDQKNECSFVSLRDVERAMIVFEYFYDKMDRVFTPLTQKAAQKHYNERHAVDSEDEDDEPAAHLPPRPQPLNSVTSALILSLNVCYRARLHDREPYEDTLSRCFSPPLLLQGGDQRFRDEIKWCEEGLLDCMILGPNIAKNAALRENVFMMAVCIELRIPLFLVGKPGSSKSLAKSIIQDSMHGQGSQSPVLREFKQVHMFSYQCSQLSTSESVIDIFKSAERFQAKQDVKQYVSVVVLDEVGLAEDSPSLPLKALHPLLEDGTEGSGKDYQQTIVEREKRVAFIGISNWALDPAKMNRGVMVTRGDPGKEDLELSAKGICSNKDKDPVKDRLRMYFQPLSEAYIEICTLCEKQNRQFFGLRDFYSLVKMLYWMCEKSSRALSWPQLQHAISRNFGGLESNEIKPLDVFSKKIGYMDENQDFSALDEEVYDAQ